MISSLDLVLAKPPDPIAYQLTCLKNSPSSSLFQFQLSSTNPSTKVSFLNRSKSPWFAPFSKKVTKPAVPTTGPSPYSRTLVRYMKE